MRSRGFTALVLVGCTLLGAPAAWSEDVPGVVVNHFPASSGIYIGSPGIAVLPNGRYIAKHDEFGPRSTEHDLAITQVFESSNRGASWSHLATVKGMYWASIFAHGDDLYLLGTSKYHGAVVISRSIRPPSPTWVDPT